MKNRETSRDGFSLLDVHWAHYLYRPNLKRVIRVLECLTACTLLLFFISLSPSLLFFSPPSALFRLALYPHRLGLSN